MSTLYKVESAITHPTHGYLPDSPDVRVEGRLWPVDALVELSPTDAEYFFANKCISIHTSGLKAGQIADPPPLDLPVAADAPVHEIPVEDSNGEKTDPEHPHAKRRGR